jgi:hypothetical protein
MLATDDTRDCVIQGDDWVDIDSPWSREPEPVSRDDEGTESEDESAVRDLPSVLRGFKATFNKIIAKMRFEQLAQEWKDETGILSNVTARVLHPAYQQVIGMGDAAVPLILKDLAENGPDDWFWALTSITGDNPITEDIAGDMKAMTEAWLRWGRRTGYLRSSDLMS